MKINAAHYILLLKFAITTFFIFIIIESNIFILLSIPRVRKYISYHRLSNMLKYEIHKVWTLQFMYQISKYGGILVTTSLKFLGWHIIRQIFEGISGSSTWMDDWTSIRHVHLWNWHIWNASFPLSCRIDLKLFWSVTFLNILVLFESKLYNITSSG